MNPRLFDEAIEDLRRRLPRPDLVAAVLFGSAARGEATEDSDIDLLVVPKRVTSFPRVNRVIEAVERERNVRVGIIVAKPTLEDVERQLLDSILREGKVLAGAMPKVDVRDLDLEPVRLVALDLRELPNPEKVRLARTLFGYRTRKRYRRKVYSREVPGKLKGWRGRQINRGTILVPERHIGELDRILRERGAKRWIIPMWIQRP